MLANDHRPRCNRLYSFYILTFLGKLLRHIYSERRLHEFESNASHVEVDEITRTMGFLPTPFFFEKIELAVANNLPTKWTESKNAKNS